MKPICCDDSWEIARAVFMEVHEEKEFTNIGHKEVIERIRSVDLAGHSAAEGGRAARATGADWAAAMVNDSNPTSRDMRSYSSAAAGPSTTGLSRYI
jgi:hypothetical protein